MEEWATIISLDPGGTTGWCVMSVHTDALLQPRIRVLNNIMHWSQGQIYGDLVEQLDGVVELFGAWPGIPVVTERFTLRKFLMDEELLSPARINLAVEWLCRGGPVVGRGRAAERMLEERALVMQNADEAKSVATNMRLRDWGLYVSDGEVHARDATRHAITWMRKAKRDRKRRAETWPDLVGG